MGKIRSEDSELIRFFDWLSWQAKKAPVLEIVFHPENERKTSFAAGNLRKRKGVRAGVPDIVAPIPTKEYRGLVIELKTKTGKTSQNQEKMLGLFHAVGWKACIARSGDEAIEIFKSYIKGV